VSIDRIEELERRIAEIKQRIPPHSVKLQMLEELEEIVQGQGPGGSRIKATHCVDMLASTETREKLSGGKGENVYWFTPGWLLYRQYVFQDRDKGFAIENFPKHKYTEGAGLLDSIDFYDKYCEEHAEEVLDFSDWMELPIQAYKIPLDRLKNLLLEARL